MVESYVNYYKNQAGSGIPAFESLQYQRGHGFFGDTFKYFYNKLLKPAGNYLLPKAINTGKKIGADIMGGKNILESLTKNLGETAEEMMDDGVGRVKKFIQTG